MRRRYSHGLSFLANYTYAKNLTNAPDFRSPMDEASIPQNNMTSKPKKVRAVMCAIASRSAAFTTFRRIPRTEWARMVTQNWHFSTIYQVTIGMPFTISVFGDTANSGTVLGENPIRANVTGQPIFGPGTRTANRMVQPCGFRYAAGLYIWQCWPEFGLRSPHADSGLCHGADVSVLPRRASFQFRAEAFNSLNKTNLGTPNRFVNTPQFGTITMAMTPGREIQLSARFSF